MKRTISALLQAPAAYRLVRLVERVVPPIRAWHRFAYDRHFFRLSKKDRLFRGVYASFSEAFRAVPASQHFHDPAGDTVNLESLGRIWPADYPVLFWLRPLLSDDCRIFDFGGHVGLHYYSFQNYLPFPPTLQWTVCDLPPATKAGAELAAARNLTALRFTNDFAQASGADILLASGSLQYVETPFPASLSALAEKPEHLILNKVPLSPEKSYVTLQCIGPSICPYHIFNRREFVDAISSLGYECIDAWRNVDFDCFIPYHPEESLDAFTGLYFRRR